VLIKRDFNILDNSSKFDSFRRASTQVVHQADFVNSGEKLSVYSFLLAGGLVKDVVIRDFDVFIEVPRQSLICVFAIFKYHSLLNFDFLVDLVS
jgi:hypothetical protein